MLQECLMSDFQRKSSFENFRRVRWPEDTQNASLKDFDIPMGSWEQTALVRSKCRCLINNGAALYEGKIICEAERGGIERNANTKTNGPTTDSMTLTCSICNRQFRARISIVSHQRTHLHTRFLISKRRTAIKKLQAFMRNNE